MGNSRHRRTIIAVFISLLVPAFAWGGAVERWTVDITTISQHKIYAYHGETLSMECQMLRDSKIYNPYPYSAEFLWQTNGMGSAWWKTNATISVGIVKADFVPAMDSGASEVTFFFNVMDSKGSMYRINGTIVFYNSPAGDMHVVPLPTKTLDFAMVEVLNPDTSPFALAKRPSLTKIGDYLWEAGTEYEDWNKATNHLAKVYPSYGACTGIHAGHLHGRNLDWVYNKGATLVVHSSAKEGKFASIGMSEGSHDLTDDFLASGKWSDSFYSFPFVWSDGMNEKGVVIQQNVIPKDIAKSAAWRTNHSNRVISFAVIRYALDRCATAREAADMINEKIFVPSEFEYDFHFLISDATSTFVVEDGNVYSNTVPTDVMTNFRIGTAQYNADADNTVKWETVENYGIGLERYDWIRTNGLDKSNLDGMISTMTNLWYTRAYEPMTVPFWYTENCSDSDPLLTVMNAKTNQSVFADAVAEDYISYTNEHDKASSQYRSGVTWQTTHTAIYDQSNLILRLFSQEKIDSEKLFYLNQKGTTVADNLIIKGDNGSVYRIGVDTSGKITVTIIP